VFFTGKHKEIVSLTRQELAVLNPIRPCNWSILAFYYKALQMGEVSKVAPIDKLSVVFTIIMAFLFLGGAS